MGYTNRSVFQRPLWRLGESNVTEFKVGDEEAVVDHGEIMRAGIKVVSAE